uniref:Gamma-glutamylcyclotransferase AIG2-like domain-containing protein n=1 Tax=viral metagenome TaxID=1070528 RepID=A0A6C0F6Y0_9ZZZZ|tara:strand:+ start:2364 stop:3098 length:735 start_codon:yes stop_codon:yes gene_type:complete
MKPKHKTRKKNIKNKIKKNKTIKRIKCFDYKPKNFIFGYGSLISKESRIYTGKGYIGDPIPVEISKKAGYRRIWICKKSKFSNKSYLALRKSKKATNIRGIIYPIFKCIENFDKREHGYKRVKIKINTKEKRKLVKSITWKNVPNYDFNIYMYIDNKSKPPNKKCPISQRYLDVVLSGNLGYGIKFAKHFLKNTFNWKDDNGAVFLVNDRKKKNPRKYDLQYINYKRIDKIMKETIPHYFKKRV